MTANDIGIFADHGVRHLELTIRDGFSCLSDADQVATLKAAVDSRAIVLHSAHLYQDGENCLSDSSCDIEKVARIMRALGGFKTKYLVLHPGDKIEREANAERRLRHCIDHVEQLYPAILDSQVTLALETMPPGKPMSNFDEIDFVMERTDPELVGLCVDVNHILGGTDPAKLIERYDNRILGFHFSDNDGLEEKHWPPFRGCIRWREVMQAIARIQYHGPLNFEYGFADDLAVELQTRTGLFARLLEEKV